MSLYLCIFADDTELAGVEAGSYAEYGALREAVTELEGAAPGSRFPIFLRAADSQGGWSVEDCGRLEVELAAVAAAMRERPARAFPSAAQQRIAEARGVKPSNAAESFLDVDGAFLLERLQDLVAIARREGRPVLFQ